MLEDCLNKENEEKIDEHIKLVHFVLKQMNISALDRNYEEYFSEGLLGLAKAWKNYQQDKARFSSFAYMCIRNSILNKIRKDQKEILTYSVSLDNPLTNEEDERLTIIDTVKEEEIDYSLKLTAQQIMEVIKNTDLKRKDIYLKYLKGMSQTQIAKIHKCSRQYVSIIIIENNCKLKEIIKDYL